MGADTHTCIPTIHTGSILRNKASAGHRPALAWFNEYTSDPTNSRKCITQVHPYRLYKTLGIIIKQVIVCGRKQSPVVKISIGFDYLFFKGGLQTAGTPARCVQGYQWYKNERYSDLDSYLGPNWHYRGVNEHGDYTYAVLESIEFYLYK